MSTGVTFMIKNYIDHKDPPHILLYYLRPVHHGTLHPRLSSEPNKACMTFNFLFLKGVNERKSLIHIAIALSH